MNTYEQEQDRLEAQHDAFLEACDFWNVDPSDDEGAAFVMRWLDEQEQEAHEAWAEAVAEARLEEGLRYER